MKKVNVKIAGKAVCVCLRFDENARYFTAFETEEEPVTEVGLPAEYINKIRKYYAAGLPESYLEFNELQFALSGALRGYGIGAMHSVAFEWKGRAWLFAAQSGVGKTTQYRNWKNLYGDEIRIINGDKVFIDFSPETPVVYSCPWMGKEHLGENISAPLGGIIFLTRSKENRIHLTSPREIVQPLMYQFITLYETPDEARQIASFEEKLLTSSPVWMLNNVGDEDSARLTRGTVEEYLKGKNL